MLLTKPLVSSQAATAATHQVPSPLRPRLGGGTTEAEGVEEEEPQARYTSPDQPPRRPAAERARESEEASWAEGGAGDEWLRLDTLATRSSPQVSLRPHTLVA